MKLNKTDKQVLTYLYKKYKQEHKSSKSMLNEFSIFILDKGLKNAVPELYGSDPELEKIKKHAEDPISDCQYSIM